MCRSKFCNLIRNTVKWCVRFSTVYFSHTTKSVNWKVWPNFIIYLSIRLSSSQETFWEYLFNCPVNFCNWKAKLSSPVDDTSSFSEGIRKFKNRMNGYHNYFSLIKNKFQGSDRLNRANAGEALKSYLKSVFLKTETFLYIAFIFFEKHCCDWRFTYFLN